MRAARGTIPLVSLLVVLVVWMGMSAAVAAPSPDAEDDFTARIAAERASAGLAGYTVAPDLVDVARRHAEEMASQDRLFHNPRLTTQVDGWDNVGENVGTGETVADIHRAFMASPTHRSEILHRKFTEVGVGVVERDGVVWVVQVFRNPSAPATASAAPAAPPRPVATTSAPAPTTSTTPSTTTTVTVEPPITPETVPEATLQAPPVSVADRPSVVAGSTLRRAPTLDARTVTSAMAAASTLLMLVVAALVAQVATESRRADVVVA